MTLSLYSRPAILISFTLLVACGTSDRDGHDDPLPGPEVVIKAPGPDFFQKLVWDDTGVAPVNRILTLVSGEISTTDGPPTVLVNEKEITEIFLIDTNLYQFDMWVPLSKGPATITAVGTNSQGGSTTAMVSGEADYCVRGRSEAGVSAEKGFNQSSRCHEINGCNKNKFGLTGLTDTKSLRNQPMPKAKHHLVRVEFGSGYLAPEGEIDIRNDAFVHGDRPKDALGCNIHDACYQTCEPGGKDKQAAAWRACNERQLINHQAMCDKAYPVGTYPEKCPILGGRVCRQWNNERERCSDIANRYYKGVKTTNILGIKDGWEIYLERQAEYCAS